MHWERGRQGTGYRKLKIGSGRRWDAWLLDYPAGVGIPDHVDPVPGKRHLRINLALLRGGSSVDATAPIVQIGPLVVFWSDRPHRVEPGRGRRVVLSIGVAI